MKSPDSPDAAHSDDASSWRALEHRFRSALLALQPRIDPTASPIDPALPTEEARARWFQECINTNAPVLDRVREWIRAGSVSLDAPRYELMFAARLEAALGFVHQFVVVKRDFPGGPPREFSVFPFPQIPEQDLLRFLLVDWWLSVGMNAFFESAMAKGTEQ